MTSTRFNSFPVGGYHAGFESGQTTTIEIPGVGIWDVDESLVKTLRDEVKFEVEVGDSSVNVPVAFATGEKWSLQKNKKTVRDQNGALILPLITVHRDGITMDSASSRGMSQNSGEFVVKYRLSDRDRNLQNLRNRFGIDLQSNLPPPVLDNSDGRDVGSLADDPDIQDGAYLVPKLSSNVWEVIVMPAPRFFVAKYTITMWAHYATHLNEMCEHLMNSFLAPGNRTLRLNTESGYWFIAQFGEEFSSEDNQDAATSEEDIRKVSVTVEVRAYTFGSKNPSDPVAVRRYLSSPEIEFDLQIDSGESENYEVDRIYDDGSFLGDVTEISNSHLMPNPNLIDGHIKLSPENKREPSFKNVNREQRRVKSEKITKGKLRDVYLKTKI